MKKSRFSEEKIVKILQEAESGVSVADLCRKHGMGDAAFYIWRQKYGGLTVTDLKLGGAPVHHAQSLPTPTSPK